MPAFSYFLYLYQGSWNLDFENRDRLALPLHDDVAQGSDVVLPREPGPGRVAHDKAGFVFLVEGLQARPQVHVVADHRVAHDRRRPDIAGDHVAGIDADANIALGHPRARPPLL